MYAKVFVGYCEKLGREIPVCTHFADTGIVVQVDCQHASCSRSEFCPLYLLASKPDIMDT